MIWMCTRKHWIRCFCLWWWEKWFSSDIVGWLAGWLIGWGPARVVCSIESQYIYTIFLHNIHKDKDGSWKIEPISFSIYFFIFSFFFFPLMKNSAIIRITRTYSSTIIHRFFLSLLHTGSIDIVLHPPKIPLSYNALETTRMNLKPLEKLKTLVGFYGLK